MKKLTKYQRTYAIAALDARAKTAQAQRRQALIDAKGYQVELQTKKEHNQALLKKLEEAILAYKGKEEVVIFDNTPRGPSSGSVTTTFRACGGIITKTVRSSGALCSMGSSGPEEVDFEVLSQRLKVYDQPDPRLVLGALKALGVEAAPCSREQIREAIEAFLKANGL